MLRSGPKFAKHGNVGKKAQVTGVRRGPGEGGNSGPEPTDGATKPSDGTTLGRRLGLP
jgi:hypothetical protein